MSVLMFLGRWVWIAVIAVSVLIGAYLFQLINDFEDSASLVSDVGELRGYQEELLQAQLTSAMLGLAPSESQAGILADAEASAVALVSRIDPHRHDCDGSCAPGSHDPTHNHRIAESIEAVVRDLHALANISADETADYVDALQQSPAFALAADHGGLAGADADSSEVAMGSFDLAVMGVRYVTISASVTRHLDAATNALADDGREAARGRSNARAGSGSGRCWWVV